MFAPILLDIFAVMLKRAFEASTETDDIYLHARTVRRLFSLPRLRAKFKVSEVIKDILFADDAALAVHSEEQLQ